MPIENAEGIKERLLSERQYLVIIKLSDEGEIPVPEKTDKITVRQGTAYLFQVQSVCRVLKYEPYELHDNNGVAVGKLAPRTGLDYNYLYDGTGMDILRNEDDEWLIYHISLAVQQPEIRVYPQIPPAKLLGGWDWLVSNQPYPQAGSDYGYIAGRDIENYFNPPAALETCGWKKRQGEKSYNRYGFFNESYEKDILPIFNILGRGYQVHPIMDDLTKRKVLAGPPYGPPRTLISLGPVRDLFSLDIPEEWDKAECRLNIKGAQLAEDLVKSPGMKVPATTAAAKQ